MSLVHKHSQAEAEIHIQLSTECGFFYMPSNSRHVSNYDLTTNTDNGEREAIPSAQGIVTRETLRGGRPLKVRDINM